MSSFVSGPGEFNTSSDNNPTITIKGLSTDTKPSATTYTGYLFLETDTSKLYAAYGGIWNLVSSTGGVVQNTTIDAGLNIIKESMNADAYVYIDSNDGNKIKGRMNRTGTVYSHATNADVVLNAVITELSTNSVYNSSNNGYLNYWSGGRYGTIFLGPGVFYIYSAIIMNSQIAIIGCGSWITRIKWASGAAPNNDNENMIMSASWAVQQTATSGGTKGERGIVIKGVTIDGSRAQRTVSNTLPTPGVQSWGHGIAFYGYGLILDDVVNAMNPGAGIIVQTPTVGFWPNQAPTATVSGFPQPQSVFPGNQISNFTNITQAWNGAHGVLCRAPLSINGIQSYNNGEPGLDVQSCQYFAGNLRMLTNGNMFWDSTNHINGTYTTDVTYSPDGPEIRITGGGVNWISNLWVEAPSCCGDSIQLGIPGNTLLTPTGYSLLGYCYSTRLDNVRIDDMRHDAIWIGPVTADVWGSVEIHAGQEFSPGSLWQFQNGIRIVGRPSNLVDLDVQIEGLTPYGSCLTVGDTSASYNNNIRMHGVTNSRWLTWANTGNLSNYVSINDFTYNSVGGVILDPASVAITTTGNIIEVTGCPGATGAQKGRNGGIATFSGNGSTTVFTIPHLLWSTPSVANVNANTVDARGEFIITVDATNITVTYPLAPPTGTNNIKLYWNARVQA